MNMSTTNLITPISFNDLSFPVPESGRMYYVDVYTGQSVLCYESPEILTAISILSQFVHPAQCISFYSYKSDPLPNRNIYESH